MKTLATLSMLTIVLVWTTPALAGEADTPKASTSATAPPPRPLGITVEQASALERLAQRPEVAIAADTRAAYTPDAQQQASEAAAVGVHVGIPAAVLVILIAAAPL